MNSPWAKLITRIMPKMIANPAQASARLAIPFSTSMIRSAAVSTAHPS